MGSTPPPSADSSTQVLTVEETAHTLRVHPDTIWRAIDRGEIACTRIGRTVRIPRAELIRLTSPKPVGELVVGVDVVGP